MITVISLYLICSSPNTNSLAFLSKIISTALNHINGTTLSSISLYSTVCMAVNTHIKGLQTKRDTENKGPN